MEPKSFMCALKLELCLALVCMLPYVTGAGAAKLGCRVTVPKKPWEETVEAYGARLRTAAAHINAHFDVDGLCRALPRRAAALIKAEGGRLAK
jgi:uncharacterized MAPEG superfamily protein